MLVIAVFSVWCVMQGAICPAFFLQPLPAPGYYPVSREVFTACFPASACPGGDLSMLANLTFTLDTFYGTNNSLALVTTNVSAFSNWTQMNAALNLTFSTCVRGMEVRMVESFSYRRVMKHVPCVLDAFAGYDGLQCKKCEHGFYRLEEECIVCPKGAFMLIVVAVMFVGKSWL